jgi:hypothetical protein
VEGAGVLVPVLVALGAGLGTFLLAASGRGRAAMWVTAGLLALPFAFGIAVQAVDRHGTAGLGALVVIVLFFLPALLGAAIGWGLGSWVERRRGD